MTEQAAESVFGVEKSPGVAGGVVRGKSTDDRHDEGDEDGVVVEVGLAMMCCCFGFEGTPGGVLETGLGLGVDLVAALDVAVKRGGTCLGSLFLTYGCSTVFFWVPVIEAHGGSRRNVDSELRVLIVVRSRSKCPAAPRPRKKGRFRVAISDRPPSPPWDPRLPERKTVCLRFVLKASHVRREPRKDPLRDA